MVQFIHWYKTRAWYSGELTTTINARKWDIFQVTFVTTSNCCIIRWWKLLGAALTWCWIHGLKSRILAGRVSLRPSRSLRGEIGCRKIGWAGWPFRVPIARNESSWKHPYHSSVSVKICLNSDHWSLVGMQCWCIQERIEAKELLTKTKWFTKTQRGYRQQFRRRFSPTGSIRWWIWDQQPIHIFPRTSENVNKAWNNMLGSLCRPTSRHALSLWFNVGNVGQVLHCDSP